MSPAVAKQQPLVVDLETVPPGSTVPATRASDELSVFERLATAPGMDVDRLERLMQMHERMQARAAEQAFNAAMSAAQDEMRPVGADASNHQTHSRYASYAALDLALRPIYTKHGFGVSYDTGETDKPDHVRVLGYVTHGGGHARTYHLDMPADGKGAKGGDVMTKTHATGAAMSYGMRYLLKMIFNVAVGEDDRDGNAPRERQNAKAEPQAPSGFDDWLADLSAVADEGQERLKAAWEASYLKHRKHLTSTNPQAWEQLKRKAVQVGR